MTQSELNDVLKQHQLWLNTKGEEGKRADLRGVDLTGVDLTGANLICADLRYSYLKGADLRDADLEGANLEDANLIGANLKGANLKYANLTNVNLTDTGIYFFIGPKHEGIYNSNDDKLYIGCQVHNLDYWLKNYVTIGKEHGYSKEEIKTYGSWFKSLKGI